MTITIAIYLYIVGVPITGCSLVNNWQEFKRFWILNTAFCLIWPIGWPILLLVILYMKLDR